MTPAAFTFAFVAGYLALGTVVALLLGRVIALRERQVPPVPREVDVPGGKVLSFDRELTQDELDRFRAEWEKHR